jgi:hypothetical protein
MARLLRAEQTRTDTVAGPAKRWYVGNALAVCLEQRKVSVGLLSVPGPHRAVGDIVEVDLRTPRELNLGHGHRLTLIAPTAIEIPRFEKIAFIVTADSGF